MKSIKRIYLTGYMGSGKSHMAEMLAQRLGWLHVELDQLIEDKMGLPISEIFEKHGEDHFRAIEAELVETTLVNGSPSVVALGGGSYCQQLIHDSINNDPSSFTVYLKYSASFLSSRLNDEIAHRPLLREVDDLEAFIEEHLRVRNTFYNYAELIIEDETDSQKIQEQILAYLEYRNQN